MKKVLILFLIFALLITPLSLNFAFAEGDVLDEEPFSAVDFLEEFVTNNSDRLAGTEGEKKAAAFIAENYFEELVEKYGYIPYNENAEGKEKYYQEFNFIDDETSKKSQNVIVTKPASKVSEKTVIIGAHYDNAYKLPEGTDAGDYKMQGAYDNGTGVAVMMDLAYRLKDVELDFNVTFIAFGAEEEGCFGSEYYVNKLTGEELDNILIMFNLDVIGAGDKLYLYCDEVKTEHEKFLLDISNNKGIKLNSPPLDKHMLLYELNGMPYLHTGLMSDNLSFLTRGVNCAFFFTYNWEYGLAESDKNFTMLHNKNDNMNYLKDNYPNYKEFMANVSDTIYFSLYADGFEETMVLSLNNKFDYRPFFNKNMIIIVTVVILTLAAILVILTYVNLNKNKLIKSPEIIDNLAEENESVFGKEFEDDIF